MPPAKSSVQSMWASGKIEKRINYEELSSSFFVLSHVGGYF